MAAAVTFSYDGASQLQAVCTGLTPSTLHVLVSNDPNSMEQSGTSDADGNLIVTSTDIGGMTAGDLFMTYLGESDGTPTHPVATGVSEFGVPGSCDAGLAVTWSYDGATAVTATFAGAGGDTYQLHAQEGETSSVGASPLALTLATSQTDPAFLVYLKDVTTTFVNATILFTFGQAGAGYTGRAVPAFSAYATTDELFRVLKVRDASAEKIAAAQGDLDTATVEINAELDWADDHAAATTQQLELFKGVCIDRAADLWRHRESAPGVLGIVDEGVPTTSGRYSWARYAARLSSEKDQWGVA